MEKSTSNIIIVILLILVMLGLYDEYKKNELNEELIAKIEELLGSKSGACDDSNRYHTSLYDCAVEFNSADANKLINEYREKHIDDANIYKYTGWHISKKAIDSIFSRDLRANSIAMDLINQGDTALGLIIKGIQSDSSKVLFESSINSSVFHIYSMCPKDCSNY